MSAPYAPEELAGRPVIFNLTQGDHFRVWFTPGYSTDFVFERWDEQGAVARPLTALWQITVIPTSYLHEAVKFRAP